MTHVYEVMFLLDPNKASADWEGTVGAANGTLQRHGAELIHTQSWGEFKLAYPIKKFRKGSFLLTFFRVESKAIPVIEADLRLVDVVARYLIIRHHDKLADFVIGQVTGQNAPEELVGIGDGRQG